MTNKSKRILSGIQPTGNLHLGNYLGAIRNWVKLQQDSQCFYMLADLHAITVFQEPEKLRASMRESAASLIACGVDPKRSAIFPQSAVVEHSELAWILSCHTPLGWLNRMTQFKEKTKISLDKRNPADLEMSYKNTISNIRDYIKNIKDLDEIYLDELREEIDTVEALHKDILKTIKSQNNLFDQAQLGLYSYPVLMAADILLYKATHVPVGADQKQHIELCRDIAGAFNRAYNKECFTLPEPLILGEATRVMSLRDGTKKMSKSDESDYSRINLTDDADTIAKKFKKATSDSFSTVGEKIDERPEASNLLSIYAALKNISREAALAECASMNFSAFKAQLTELAVAELSPITGKMRELLADPAELDRLLADGATQAREMAGVTMKEIKEIVGFLEA